MSLRINAEHITKKVKLKTILEDVTLRLEEKSFVALIGPSGAGKTTLLNILSGYDTNFEGEVYYNQYSIKKNDLRKKVAYVPQTEILHKNLTLYKELWYIAKIRMAKTPNKIIKEKLRKVMNDLELNGKEKTVIKHLSGGERKRLSIALELLFDPEVLILDEPTSGLDLHIQKKLMQLLKKISENGTTIIISAHTTSNLELCDEILVMSNKGKICYEGSYKNSLKYFKVKEFVDIYNLVLKDTKKYEKDYEEQLAKKKEERKARDQKQKKNEKHNILKETFYLVLRHFEILWHDKFTLFMLFFQVIMIAIFCNIAVPKTGLEEYTSAKITLFAISCAAMWIGLFNSVQEIVKEKKVIKREYMSTLNMNAYIASKVISFFLISLIQSTLFITVIFFHFNTLDKGLIFSNIYFEYIIHFLLISFSSCMLGLWISCIVKKQELTLILAILYMMIQLIFSGILLPLDGISDKFSNVVIGRHAVSLFGSSTNLIEVVKTTTLNAAFDPSITSILFLDEAEKFFEYQSFHVLYIWFVLIDMALIFIFLASLSLRLMIPKETD